MWGICVAWGLLCLIEECRDDRNWVCEGKLADPLSRPSRRFARQAFSIPPLFIALMRQHCGGVVCLPPLLESELAEQLCDLFSGGYQTSANCTLASCENFSAPEPHSFILLSCRSHIYKAFDPHKLRFAQSWQVVVRPCSPRKLCDMRPL